MPGDESNQVSASEIEELLRQAREGTAPGGSPAAGASSTATSDASGAGATHADSTVSSKPGVSKPAAKPVVPSPSHGENSIAQADIELLLSHAEKALASAQGAGDDALPAGVNPFKLEDFAGAPASTEIATIELVRDVELDLKIELGRTHMYLEDVLKLRRGSVVPLDKLAGDPVDIYVNGRLIARGEVLVLNDNFCVRVAELISSEASAAAG
ncbi:MAG: flagellar motor switch protein FliN [Planctomycetia bacterium]|nr:flagellar motor switch protein FliN [Planctomycetia bacterium]